MARKKAKKKRASKKVTLIIKLDRRVDRFPCRSMDEAVERARAIQERRADFQHILTDIMVGRKPFHVSPNGRVWEGPSGSDTYTEVTKYKLW